MTKNDDVRRTGFADDAEVADGQDDFAGEHDDTSFADDSRDGPEHSREPDQPDDHGGL
jgi:hypothetical protein